MKKNNSIRNVFFIIGLMLLNVTLMAQNGMFVNTYVQNFQNWPDIAMNNNGETVSVWESAGQDGSGNGVYGQRFDANRLPIGGEFQINTTTNLDQGRPKVGISSNGSFIVVWQSPDADGRGIYGQLFDNNGNAVNNEFLINSIEGGMQQAPDVAMNANGEFVVVWTHDTQDTINDECDDIHARRFDANGNQIGSELTINNYTNGCQRRPSVDLLDDGRFVVAWDGRGANGNKEVFARQFLANNSPVQASDIEVNIATFNEEFDANVAYFDDGTMIVTWEQFINPGNQSEIFGQFYNAAGNDFGTNFQINTTINGRQGWHSTSGNSTGDFIVTWTSTDSVNNGIYAQRYQNGLTFGNEFKVFGDSVDTGLSWVAMNDDNDFTVIATARGDDEFEPEKFGVWGQAFDQNLMVLSTKNLMDENPILLYPNPVQDELTLENAIGTITIYNQIGQPIRRFENRQEVAKVEVNYLPKGLYYILVENDGKKNSQRFLKQ